MNTIEAKNLQKTAQENDYKFIRLQDQAGNVIIPWNGANTKIDKRIAEIQNRVKHLPTGVYSILFKNRMGRGYPEFPYFISVGGAQLEENRAHTPVIIHQPQTESVRGWNEALQDKEKIAQQSATIDALQKEMAALKETLSEEEDEDEEEGEQMSQGNAILTGLREIAPQFLPLADTWREIQLKKLELEEKRLQLAERGVITTPQQQQRPQQPRLRKSQPFRPLPELTDETRVDAYLNYLEKLPEVAFNNELAYVQQTNPELLAVIIEEFQLNNNDETQN